MSPHRGEGKNMSKKITTEQFDEILSNILDEQPACVLLTIPGLYEIVSEHFNNDVLTLWEAEQNL